MAPRLILAPVGCSPGTDNAGMLPWNRRIVRGPFRPPEPRAWSPGEPQEPGRPQPGMGLVSWLGRALRALRSRCKSPAPRFRVKRSRQMHWLEEASKTWELARSAGGFALGMALASLYGALVLLAQGHNVWYCLVTTIGLGAGLALGMAFSVKVRATVLLSLPHVFTSKQPSVAPPGAGLGGGCRVPAEPQTPPLSPQKRGRCWFCWWRWA